MTARIIRREATHASWPASIRSRSPQTSSSRIRPSSSGSSRSGGVHA
ncbi:hypothetical protein [Brevundimonas sp. R86498]